MQTQEFLTILDDQRAWFKSRDISNLVSRREEEQLSLDSNLAQVVIGVRRCGKSTLCEKFLLEHKAECAYVNFDDERLFRLKAEDLNRMLEAIYILYEKDINIFYFDEIQNVNAWPLFVNRLLRDGKKVFLTGSNAKLLGNELMTHLTGRAKEIDLYPFSFTEYCEMRKIKFNSYSTKTKASLESTLNEYLNEGGFPELMNESDKRGYINGLMNAIISKDISKRFKIRNVDVLYRMSGYLADNFAQVFSPQRIGKIFNISGHTAENYYHHLKEAFLFVGIPKFSFKAKDRVTGEKCYVTDLAFVSERSGTFSLQNIGWRLENAVCIELLRRCRPLYYDIFYYKENSWEVDFMVTSAGKILGLYQVCYDMTSEKTFRREVQGLVKASEKFHCEDLNLITFEKIEDIHSGGKTIKVHSASRWLLCQE